MKTMKKKKLFQIKHPLLKHKLGYLRDKNTQHNEFRDLLKEISRILTYEVMHDWKIFDHVYVQTPIARAPIERIIQAPIVVSIMRAGNGMLDGVLSMIPFASAGHIGIYRDKFVNSTVEYYFKLPNDVEGRTILLCDPLLASGDTIIAAIERLKTLKVGTIKIMCVLVSREGLARVHKAHPDVEIYYINVEEKMTAEGYLVPGLGDVGDRLFHTK